MPPDSPSRPPLPSDKTDPHANRLARIIAYWMDEFIRIPGTRIRLGLDPILGLLPGLGGLLSSSVSFIVLVEAVRLRVPLVVLARMGINILLNGVLDSIPLVGDAASIFFRSNSKNLDLIERWHAGEHHAVKRGSQWVLILFLAFWVAVVVVCVLLLTELMSIVWHLLTGTAH